MKSLVDLLSPVREALTSVSDNVGWHTANDATRTYIVYSEEFEADSVHADNRKEIQGLSGSIDLYALPKDREVFDKVQEALNAAGVAFSLASVQREDSSPKFTHYEWTFEVS